MVNDQESYDFANQICTVLQEAGWKTRLQPVQFMGGAPIKGLYIYFDNFSAFPIFGLTLQKGLQEIGYPVKLAKTKMIHDNKINLIVGHRP